MCILALLWHISAFEQKSKHFREKLLFCYCSLKSYFFLIFYKSILFQSITTLRISYFKKHVHCACTFESRKIFPGRTVQETLKMYSRTRFSINHIDLGERCVWCTGEKDELIRDYFWLASFPDLLSDPDLCPKPNS